MTEKMKQSIIEDGEEEEEKRKRFELRKRPHVYGVIPGDLK